MIDDDLLRLMATEAGMISRADADCFIANAADLRAFAEAAGRGALTAAYFASSSLECAAALRARINAAPEWLDVSRPLDAVDERLVSKDGEYDRGYRDGVSAGRSETALASSLTPWGVAHQSEDGYGYDEPPEGKKGST